MDESVGGPLHTSFRVVELEEQALSTWNLDHEQMGVGGDTSWGRPVHEEYTIPAESQRYRFRLIPYDGTDSWAAKIVESYRVTSP